MGVLKASVEMLKSQKTGVGIKNLDFFCGGMRGSRIWIFMVLASVSPSPYVFGGRGNSKYGRSRAG